MVASSLANEKITEKNDQNKTPEKVKFAGRKKNDSPILD